MSEEYPGSTTTKEDGKFFDFDPIYKKASKGGVLIWQVRIVSDSEKDGVLVLTTTGPADDRKSQKVHAKTVEGNKQASAFDRALKLNNTKRINKLRKGYFETVEEVEQGGIVRVPMCVKNLDPADIDKLPKDFFPCHVGVKDNGVRGTYFRDQHKILSRNLKEHDKMTHLLDDLKFACDLVGKDYLDFELYAHGFKINEIVSMVRRGDTRIKARIFDVPDDTSTWRERLANIVAIRNTVNLQHLQFKAWFVAKSAGELKDFYFQAVENKEEGIIVMRLDGTYKWNNKNSRDDRVMKVKPLISHEFDIVSVGIEKRIHEGQTYYLVEFVCETIEGLTFKVPPTSWGLVKRDRIGREYMKIKKLQGLFSKYVDNLAPLTIEFREWTSAGKPFHIVEVISRDYE